jgi:hypothetical protein
MFITPAPIIFLIPSFVRNSIATIVNFQGLTEVVQANTPRFDHDPVTLTPKGLLLEVEETNFLTRYSDLTQWTKARSIATVSADFPIFANDGVLYWQAMAHPVVKV